MIDFMIYKLYPSQLLFYYRTHIVNIFYNYYIIHIELGIINSLRAYNICDRSHNYTSILYYIYLLI